MKRFRIIRKRSVISPDEVYMKHLDTSLDSSFDSTTATTTTTACGGATGGVVGYDHIDSHMDDDGYVRSDRHGYKSYFEKHVDSRDGDKHVDKDDDGKGDGDKDGDKDQRHEYDNDDNKDSSKPVEVQDTNNSNSVVVNKKTIDNDSDFINNDATASTTTIASMSPSYISHTFSINNENISGQSLSSSSSSSSIVIPPSSSTAININRDNRTIPTYNRPQFIFNSSGNNSCIYDSIESIIFIIITASSSSSS